MIGYHTVMGQIRKLVEQGVVEFPDHPPIYFTSFPVPHQFTIAPTHEL